jgi:hypothetical protein
MPSLRQSRLLRISGLLLGVLVWLANASNPPNGQTGAPFDGNCNNCHNGGNFNADISIDGLPATVEPSTLYPLTITVTPTAGAPTRAGFQLVVVGGTNANAGDLSNISAQTGTESSGGREYVEHRGAKTFGGNPVSWSFNWTSPASVAGNTFTFYYIANLVNGNGNNSGDNPVWSNISRPFAGPPPVVATIVSSTNVLCFGSNSGSAMVEASGGNPPYTYAWSNGQTSTTAINLTAGTYTVTVTASGGSGTATASVTITQPPLLTASAGTSNQINCTNDEATLTATAGGGMPPYSFAWSNGGSGASIQVTAGGTYVVTVTDNNNCIKTASVTVTANLTAPTAVATPTANIPCGSSSVNLNGTGSSTGAGIVYNWTAGPGGNIVSGGTTLTPTVNAPGTYTLTVTNNNNGCTATATTTVTQASGFSASTTVTGTITCSAGTATICASPTGANYTYQWAGPGLTMPNVQCPTVTLAGTYTVTVTNTSNGCTATATALVNANTTAPGATATGGTITCTQSQVTLQATSPTPGVTYSWTGPNFSSSLQNPTVGQAGNYTVTVTNPANGCTSTAVATVIGSTAQPNVSATGSATLTCAQPCINLTASSTTPNATFAWSGPSGPFPPQPTVSACVAGNYTVIVTNPTNGCTATATSTVSANNTAPTVTATGGTITCTALNVLVCASTNAATPTYLWNGPNGFTSSLQCPQVAVPGSYAVTVTNPANGCTNTASAQVQLNTSQPTASILPPANLNCNTTSVQLNGTSSSSGAGITYTWSTANGVILGATNLPTATAGGPGTYVLLVTNTTNGCTAQASATVAQTPAVTAAIGQTVAVSCFGGSSGIATAVAGGGAPPLAFSWPGGATTATVNGLSVGNYTVTVTDSENCTATATAIITEPTPLVVNATATPVSAPNANDGTATAAPTGGTSPYLYSWSNDATTPTITGLAPGNYTVVITDANGCTALQTVTVNGVNCALVATLQSANVTCFGASNGSATVQLTGAANPVSYTWSNGDSLATASNLAPGTYTVEILDANDCPAALTATITEPALLQANASATAVSGVGINDGTATVQPTGGTPPYNVLWSNGATSLQITGLAPGTYTPTVTDANGCTAVQSVVVNAFNCALAVSTTVIEVACAGDSTGQATVVLNGGTLPYSYAWSNGTTGATATGLPAGSYSVTATDAAGCTLQQTVNIGEPPALTGQVTILSIGCSAAGVLVEATGGTPPYSYLWSNGSTTAVVTNLPFGLNSVIVTDSLGCTVQLPANIIATAPLAITVADVQHVSCLEDSTGVAQVVATGGSGAYTVEWSSPSGTGLNLAAGSYTVTVTDGNGCTATEMFTVEAKDNVAPTLICPESQTVCAGTTVQFELPEAVDNCLLPPNAVTQVGGLLSGSEVPAGPTVQQFVATDALGNSSTCSFTIIGTEAPSIVLVNVGNDINSAQVGSITIEVSNTPPDTFSVAWTLDGELVSTEQNPTGLGAGLYTVVVTNSAGCSSSLGPIEVSNTVGNSEPAAVIRLRLWPNPAEATIQFALSDLQPVQARLLTPRGQLVREIEPAELAAPISVAVLPAGLYVVQLVDSKGRSFTLRFIKA